VAASFGTAGRQGLTEGGATALIGLLITLLLAFLMGGYAAGRMAARSGLKHGLLVPLLALVVTVVLAIIGGLLGVSFIDQLSGITLPQGAQQSAQQAAPQQGLGTILSVSGLLALLFPFIGGAIGGLWGRGPAPAGLRRVMCNELDQQVRQVTQRSAERSVDRLCAGVGRDLGGQSPQQPSQRLGAVAPQSEDVVQLADKTPSMIWRLPSEASPPTIGLRPRPAGVVVGGVPPPAPRIPEANAAPSAPP
jgi:hypothetical protein